MHEDQGGTFALLERTQNKLDCSDKRLQDCEDELDGPTLAGSLPIPTAADWRPALAE